MKEFDIPKKPSEPAANGYAWVYDQESGWHEVRLDIRMPDDPPFMPEDTPPILWPIDTTQPEIHSKN